MLTIHLEPHDEEEWLGENPAPGTFADDQQPLRHQILTAQAETPLIINAFNTGTGKTKAALLRLLVRYLGKPHLDPLSDNILFIAPTNELLAQHARDIKRFCQENGLPYRVIAISRADLDGIQSRPGFSEAALRKGAALHAIMRDPRQVAHDRENVATIFVVNPDIFYYAFYFQYGHNDRIPLFDAIFTTCNYIVVDEFHYYNPKQLANFLFFMHLSQHFGFFASGRQICLLTATPDPNVTRYLDRLNIPCTLIDPRVVPPVAPGECRPTRALAPVMLQVYSVDELRGAADDPSGLIALVAHARREIAQWLADGDAGAIISGSLWNITHIFNGLRGSLSPDQYGRITGPEQREGRQQAAQKPLILATPTVDIGYNFERGDKRRQNIDFLFCDARSGDELLQRLGRAGRVLGKPEQSIPSRVAIVVPTECYATLQAYDGQSLARQTLREVVMSTMPARNDLYAYIGTGAIAEAFLPLYRLSLMTPSDHEGDIITLFDSVRTVFAGSAKLTYRTLKSRIQAYIARDDCYRAFGDGVAQRLAEIKALPADGATSLKWQQSLIARLRQAQKADNGSSIRRHADIVPWLMDDARHYFAERARFDFRDAFQPPQALLYDPHLIHTSADVAHDDVLRLTRFYHMRWYASADEWAQQTGKAVPNFAEDAVLWGRIVGLREPNEQLQLGLRLDARAMVSADWEEQFAYKMTALYGITVYALNDGSGLHLDVSLLLADRFLPALVVRDGSYSSHALWGLRKRAQIIPYDMEVTFGDGATAKYWVVLGTQALLVGAEIQTALARDSHRVQADDDRPLIC